MDWDGVLAADLVQVDQTESLADSLYSFMVANELPQDSQLLGDLGRVTKLFNVMRAVMKVKGEEAQAAFEELSAREHGEVGGTERDLLDQIVHLEKEVRLRDGTISEMRERGAASSGNEARYLREEIEDLKHELAESKRILDHERLENERMTSDASAERLRSRQLEREVDRLKQNLEDYRRQLEWQRDSTSTKQRTGESDFRERLRAKDLEIAEQLDKIEELLNARDDLERQLHELTVQLGHVEEQRLLAIKDTEKMRVALADSDRRADELETRNKLFEGQVSDLQERLREQSGADEQIMTLVNAKAKEWEALLSSKQTELTECQGRMNQLEEQLRVAQRDTNRATIVRLKKQLQERDGQIAALQEDLSEAAGSIESLSSQLDQARRKADPLLVSQTLHQEGVQLREEVEGLRGDLEQEVTRRQEAEVQKEEKDVELTQALRRLGEYEQGEYGLHEAVQEIKMKKEEISVRDRDIAELTRHVNSLEIQLNQLGEENKALRDQLGLGGEESVDLSQLRLKRNVEMEQLRSMNRMLEKEVERLEEEKLSVRKQLVEQAMNRGQRAVERGLTSEDLTAVERYAESLKKVRREGSNSLTQPQQWPSSDQALRTQVSELQRVCDSERRRNEQSQGKISNLSAQLKDCREQLKQYEAAVKQLAQQRGKGEDGGEIRSDALERLVAMLEARNADGKYDITLQLKTEVSHLSGQNSELRSRLQTTEHDLREAVRQMERKQFQVEDLQKEVKVLRKTSSGFQPLHLPEGIPMTSNDIINGLNEHLLLALREHHSKEQSLHELQEELEKYQRKFAVIIHQQGVLYKEYLDAKSEWEREKDHLVREKNELAALREQDDVRNQEFKQLQEALNSGPDVQKQKLAEVSRKITILRVNEKALSRRYTLMHESQAALKKENHKLRQDMVAMEKAITERMGYLERHKDASLFKLSSLQHQLDGCVPAALLETANREHNELVIKYQDLLQKQTAHASVTHAMEHLQAEVKALSDQLESTRQELALEKQKCLLLQQSAPSNSQSGAGLGDNRVIAERIATLEMKELSERQRADLAIMRQRQAQETVTRLEQRNSELEERFAELTQTLLQNQAREAEQSDQLEKCITQAEKKALQAQIQKLLKSEEQLRLENAQLKEVADVARQQSVALETWQKSHDMELLSLRHQLLDLQMQSDEKTVIGKLHHQIVTVQVSEASALRKLEETNGKVMKLEASLLRYEQQRDELGDAVFHVRAESHVKIRQLRCTVQSLRRQYAGAIPLSHQEKHAELIRKLQQDKVVAEKLRESARREHEQAQDKLSQLELQHSNLQELIAALKDSKSAASKLTEWHAKLGKMRLQELKLNRTVDGLKEQVKHLEELVASSERAFSKLEQDLVQVTKDYESSQLSWEQRELELEQQLEQHQQQQYKLASAAAKADEAAGNVPDPQLPVVSQLEQALSNLQCSTQTISKLKHQAKRAEEHADQLEKALNSAQNNLLKRDKEISELRLRRSTALSHDEPDSGESVSEKTLQVAQETIEELRVLVTQKENLADKYQRLLQESRKDLQTATETHKAEVSALMQQLHSHSDSAFSKLKEAALDAVNIPQPELPSDKQLARLQELEDLVVEQQNVLGEQVKQSRLELEQANQASETHIARLKEEMEGMRRSHRAEMDNIKHALGERSSRVTELEQEVEVLEGELSAAQEAASQAPSRTMKSLVERLRNQLAIKEKQHKALSEALLQLRSDLVDTAQKSLEGHARQEIQDANIQQLVNRRTSELQTRMQELSGHLEGLKLQLQESKGRESQAQGRVHKLQEELSAKDEELLERISSLRRLESQLREQRGALDQGRSREQELIQEMHELHQRLEQNSDVDKLHRQVKTLQGKLDRQRQQYEEVLRLKTPFGGKQTESATSVEPTSQIDSKHSSVEVVRWEESKKWQKKIDSLRIRLSEKNKELDAAHKQIGSMKETLARADREKSILQGKLHSVQKSIIESSHARLSPSLPEPSKGEKTSLDQQHAFKSRVYELENEVQQLQKDVARRNLSEHHELEMRNTQLLTTIETLEAQLLQKHPQATDELHALRENERRMQADMLQCQKENMQLRFECEQATLELPRLKTRIEDQEQYIEVLKSTAEITDGNIRTAPKKDAGGRSVADLERVVVAMRKVVERLQKENSTLKKRHQDQSGATSGVTELESENRRLKAELQRVQSAAIPTREDISSKSPYTKIVAENERLRRELKKEIGKNEKFQLSLSSLELHNVKLKEELNEVSSSSRQSQSDRRHGNHEERIEMLQAEVEKKNQMLLEVKKHLREAAERERQLMAMSQDSQLSERHLIVIKERDSLQQQVAQLRKELEPFDPTFFEEIEDLKYNYQEAVQKNVQYEEQLATLSKQFGVAMPLTDS